MLFKPPYINSSYNSCKKGVVITCIKATFKAHLVVGLMFLSFFSFAQTTTTTYSATTTWVAPACVTSVSVQCWGGGGGGADRYDGSVGGQGGGGGAYSYKVVTVVPGTTYTITVGSGGSAGNGDGVAGGAGGDSWFSTNTTVMAKGGSGGQAVNESPGSDNCTDVGGAGGAAASGYGDTKYSGGSGGKQRAQDGGGGGASGGSTGDGGKGCTANGGGAAGQPAVGGGGGAGGGGSSSSGSGGAGVVPGGGGGGSDDASGSTGGAGARGQLIISYTPGYNLTLSSSNPAATPSSGMCAATTINKIYAFTITSGAPTETSDLTALAFTTSGTYIASDVANFKLWYHTSDDLSAATLVSTLTTSLGTGAHTFSSFSRTIPANATSYFWITTDLETSPTNNATIAVSAITTSDLTITSTCGTKTGTAYASGTFTISSSPTQATAEAAGANSILNTETLTLSGAAVGGSATTGAWSITSSSPAAAGSHTLSSTSQTATPETVTFKPYAGYAGTVILTLTSNGCFTTDTRTIYVLSLTTTYTTAGTTYWTAPCGITSATVQTWGAGGGGGGGGASGGAGGGGGAYSYNALTVVANSSYSVVVGAGGVGVNESGTGNSGGDSWFNNSTSSATGCMAKGGSGGAYNTTGATGGLAASGFGSLKYNGGYGGRNNGNNGGGGGSSAGTAAVGTYTVNSNTTSTGATAPSGGGNGGNGDTNGSGGTNGSAPGGGGGGGHDTNNSKGGDGANGQVIVTIPSITHPTAEAGSDQTLCQGVETNITTGASVSNNTSLTWTTVDGTGSFSNATHISNATYTPSAADATRGTVHIILTSITSCDNVADQKTITVLSELSNNTVSSAQSICTGSSPAALTGTAPAGGTGAYTYVWQESTTSSTTGFSSATGTNSNSGYSPGNLTATTWYRRVVSSGSCLSHTATAVKITVEENISANTASGAQFICTGDSPSSLSGSSPSGGNGSYAYLWEESTDNATFGNASGTNNTQNYSPGALTQDTWYRRTVSSEQIQ